LKLGADTLKRLDDAFSPSAPITSQEFFLGRLDQLEDVIDGINERGQHIVVYGERGVGKTSFANIVGTHLIGVFPVKVTCNRSDGFRALWDKAFKKVQFERTTAGSFAPISEESC
jgi:replication-associated recombination protein RarA